MSGSKKRKSGGGASLFRHAYLIAAETLLVVSVFKDWFFDRVKASDFPNWAKVIFVMAATVGFLGGVFVLVERMTRRGMSGAHTTLRRTSGLPMVAIHAAILFLLFLLYARMLGLQVFK